MSGFVAVETLQAMVPDQPVPPSVLALLVSGLVGMSIREMIDIFGDDDDGGDGDDGGGMADGGLMAEESGGDEDLGGLGGLDEGGDEFGEFGDEEFGEMEGGADNDELEHRLDELETEVGSLSSTVNTVRNENEQIAETVNDVEENVRKLLDIYEMVTRGVNPFADDVDAGGLGGGGGESFGLFSDEDEEEEEDIDEEIATADAEGFFDEDLAEDDASPETDIGDVMGEEDGTGGGDGFEDDGGTFDDGALDDDLDDFEDDFGDSGGNEMSESNTESSGDEEGGKSFAELKDEYESGDAEWADEDLAEDDAPTGETGAGEADDLLEDDPDDLLEDDPDDSDDDLADDELFDEVIEDDGIDGGEGGDATGDHPEPAGEPADADSRTEPERTEPERPAADDGAETTEGSEARRAETAGGETGGRPYLGTLPEGFAADLIVIEWLEYLVGEVGVRETARAIDYYETIDWIAEPVGDDLQDYLRGFEDREGDADGLTIDHHTQSLRYITQLDGDAADSVVLSKLGGRPGGGLDGIQR